jgi:AcrR family transcriptional regulator
VIDAALALTAETGAFPTAEAIAERAGVAPRSVFYHFPDLRSLFGAAAETQSERHWSVLRPPVAEQGLATRIAEAVVQRAELYEHISAVRRVAARHEHEWPELADRMRDSRAMLRRHLRRALSPEIVDLDRPTVAALQAVGSWECWESLRYHQGLSAAAAIAAVTTLLTSTLRRAHGSQDPLCHHRPAAL